MEPMPIGEVTVEALPSCWSHFDHLRVSGIPSGPCAVGTPPVFKVQLFPYVPQGISPSPPPWARSRFACEEDGDSCDLGVFLSPLRGAGVLAKCGVQLGLWVVAHLPS